MMKIITGSALLGSNLLEEGWDLHLPPTPALWQSSYQKKITDCDRACLWQKIGR
jgi:hypothetical protein